MSGGQSWEGRGCWERGQKAMTYTLCPCVFFEDHSDSPLGAAVTLAHELGHNFGMNHDTLERGCSCKTAADKGGCIMNPSTGQVPFASAAPGAGLRLGTRIRKQLDKELPGFLARAPVEAFRKKVRGPGSSERSTRIAERRACGLSSSPRSGGPGYGLCLEIANNPGIPHTWF